MANSIPLFSYRSILNSIIMKQFKYTLVEPNTGIVITEADNLYQLISTARQYRSELEIKRYGTRLGLVDCSRLK